MSDKYDEAVAYLTEHPEDIAEAWQIPVFRTPSKVAQAHCLFAYVTPTGKEQGNRPDAKECGCLTQIQASGPQGDNDGEFCAWTDALTDAIQADHTIPTDIESVRVEDLSTFANWQRRIDKELCRA